MCLCVYFKMITGSDLVWLGLTGSDWIWLSLTGSDWIWLGLTGSDWIWLGLTGFDWAWLDVTGSDLIYTTEGLTSTDRVYPLEDIPVWDGFIGINRQKSELRWPRRVLRQQFVKTGVNGIDDIRVVDHGHGGPGEVREKISQPTDQLVEIQSAKRHHRREFRPIIEPWIRGPTWFNQKKRWHNVPWLCVSHLTSKNTDIQCGMDRLVHY